MHSDLVTDHRDFHQVLINTPSLDSNVTLSETFMWLP